MRKLLLWIYFLTVSIAVHGQLISDEAPTGITYAKVKNGVVIYKRQPPPAELHDEITSQLKNVRNGFYEIRYALAKSDSGSPLALEKKKTDTRAGKILKTTGGLLFITIGLMALFR
jgi:hypothetical protein